MTTTASKFMSAINEAAGRLVKKIVIRDGKKVLIKYREYSVPCKDGYKRDPETGACVRMTAKERMMRSKAAQRSANKSSTKRNRAISMKRRSSLVK